MKRSMLAYFCAGLMGLGFGCSGENLDDDTGTGGKADDGQTIEGTSFELMQAGAFSAYSGVVPDFVRYGFTDDHHPGWEIAGEIEVQYDSSKKSLPIVVTVPDNNEKRLLAFVIHADAYLGRTFWGADQFVDLGQPEGTLVQLPVGNYAGYPFSDSCYSIDVRNGGDQYGTSFAGIVTEAYFGFTDSTLDQYRANNDVPWMDVLGEYTAEGTLEATRTHDGGYKGSMVMYPLWVRVPQGKNLVFKLALNKYEGNCNSGPAQFIGGVQTQTYFVPVAE